MRPCRRLLWGVPLCAQTLFSQEKQLLKALILIRPVLASGLTVCERVKKRRDEIESLIWDAAQLLFYMLAGSGTHGKLHHKVALGQQYHIS